jgi:hypothetical protein
LEQGDLEEHQHQQAQMVLTAQIQHFQPSHLMVVVVEATKAALTLVVLVGLVAEVLLPLHRLL